MINTQIPLTAGETIDLKSFVVTDVKNNNQYEFQGLKADVLSLPTVNAIGTGSTAFCIDTSEAYAYEKTTKQWYQL